MTPPPAELAGVITEPLWGYVVASYAIAALCLLALAAGFILNARYWARRARAAAQPQNDGLQ